MSTYRHPKKKKKKKGNHSKDLLVDRVIFEKRHQAGIVDSILGPIKHPLNFTPDNKTGSSFFVQTSGDSFDWVHDSVKRRCRERWREATSSNLERLQDRSRTFCHSSLWRTAGERRYVSICVWEMEQTKTMLWKDGDDEKCERKYLWPPSPPKKRRSKLHALSSLWFLCPRPPISFRWALWPPRKIIQGSKDERTGCFCRLSRTEKQKCQVSIYFLNLLRIISCEGETYYGAAVSLESVDKRAVVGIINMNCTTLESWHQ